MALFDKPHFTLSMVFRNNVFVLTAFSAHVTACDLKKSFGFVTTVTVIGRVRFHSCVKIPQLIYRYAIFCEI